MKLSLIGIAVSTPAMSSVNLNTILASPEDDGT